MWLVFGYCTGVVLNTVGESATLILKKTSRRTQAVVISEGVFCAARCCVTFYLQRMKVYELFNDWGGRGYDDSVPGEVTKTAPSGDRTT